MLRSKECLREFESQSLGEDNDLLRSIKDATSYEDFKRTEGDVTDPLRIRQEAMRDAKKVLKGWAPNTGDEGWNLDVLVDSKKRKSEGIQ
jgi:tRNA-specific adenosine deaminase 1